MAYNYLDEKAELFTDEGQRMFLKIRDRVLELLQLAGSVRMQEAISGTSGSSWQMLACIDRMLELGELRELTGSNTAGQYRVFVKAYQ